MFKCLPILLVVISLATFAQPSDFIVLKKKNNRTLKTYFPGSFISASTYTGTTLNGIITQIKNDSVFIEQREIRQVMTQFGVPALDTIIFPIRLHYQEILAFDFSNNTGRRSSRKGGLLPRIMAISGTGFIFLELVNTAYRKESLSEDNKLTALAVAAAVAGAGFLWLNLRNRNTKAGQKYKVVYVSMANKKAF
jgi:hypothetical protein